MFYCKRALKAIYIMVACAILSFIILPLNAYADENSLYLGGFPAGFVLNTDCVEVVGVCDVLTIKGMCSPSRNAGIVTGDIIESINGEKVGKVSDINTIINKDYKNYTVTILRGGDRLSLNVEPVQEMVSGGRRIGVLVKDSISGIGTVTYIDKSGKKFASLGHPVTNLNNSVISVRGGTVYGSVIYGVKKGVRGTPGELRGAFENGTVIGSAMLNNSCGVFGILNEDYDTSKLVKVSKANIGEVKIGYADIYTTVYGDEVCKYQISIVKVDASNPDNRNYVIKIEDKNLIEKTGGIVQGMSGSPIVQNGKLIGAVTHVFINDPTRGYGIAIDNMLNSY